MQDSTSPAGLQIAILGHGEMGRAMEQLLAPHHRVQVWERRAPLSLNAAVAQADVILFCLPTLPHFSLASQLPAPGSGRGLCLTIGKGLDDAGRTAVAALAAGLQAPRPVGVIYGPMISEELRAGRPGFAEFAVSDGGDRDLVWTMFSGTALRLELAADIATASWSAVLKNVYAILFGLADGAALGDNARGFLAVAALREMRSAIGVLTGRDADTTRLAALGDLITTATSIGSHHHDLGLRLARGERDGLTGEGVHTLATMTSRGILDIRHYPLLRLTADCLADPARAATMLATALQPGVEP